MLSWVETGGDTVFIGREGRLAADSGAPSALLAIIMEVSMEKKYTT